MASLEMVGPYDYTSSEIDRVVAKKSPGNYALGKRKEEEGFIVQYVGRSDSDVNPELKVKLDGKYKKFKFSYATSAKAAFEKECHNYHDFGGSQKLDNEIHPRCSDGTDLKCPACGA